MGAVEVISVRKAYGEVTVMDDVSVQIDDGQFVVLVGPSGCGKSTLLRMIAGLEDISGGEIRIGGTVVNDLLPKERDIAMVFQSYALYPHMTVAQNMSFSLKLSGIGRDEIAQKVERAARILALEDYLDRYPKQLSGGQRQRVAMGRAIVRDPAVFLFDEPLSNLDAKLRVKMRAEIKELYQELGTTTVYVTHDQIEAMTLADKVVVMRDGRVEQVGAPLEIYDRPRNTFVAGFIGSPSMNFLEGESTPEGFRTKGGAVLPGPHHPGAVTYGVRPEHLRLDPSGVEMEVSVIEPTGSETEVGGRIAGQHVVALFRDRLDARPGDRIRVSVDVTKTHLFAADGERVDVQ